MDGDDGADAIPARCVADYDGANIYPTAESDVGRRFPAGFFRIEVAPRGALEFGLSGATLSDDGSLVIVGNGGSVVRSNDDGLTFSVFNRPDRISLSAVTAAGNGNLILVGQGGVRATTPTGAELGK